MSLFQSGPYRSKILRSLVRQTQRWADKVRVGVRSLKVTLSWTTQILLYPVYGAVQTVRLAGAKIQQTVELGAMPSESTSSQSAPNALSADTAIEQVLLMIQALPLSVKLPIAFPLHRSAIAGRGGGAGVSVGELAQATAAAIAPGPGTAWENIVFVRGIAVLLETRSLVLVTNQNQILDVLTVEQQTYLHQRIILEVAEYGRFVRSQQATRQLFARLHLPNPEPLLRPARQAWKTLRGWLQPSQAPIALLPETPLQHSLAIVQRFSLLTALPIWLPQLGGLVMSGDPEREVILSDANAIQVRGDQAISQTTQVLGDTTHLPPVHIRAVATLLETRSLVLVTNQNTILDVLTADQQQQIRQKITWEVALYQRYCHIQRLTQRALARLQPATKNSPVWPPIRAFQRLMSWVQTSPVAIAANLFNESALTDDLVPRAQPALPLGRRPPQPRTTSSRGALSQPLLRPFDVPSSSPSAFTARSASNDFATPPAIVPASPQPDSLANSGSPVQSSYPLQTIRNTRPTSSDAGYIDTQATPVGYIQPWWEKFLRGLDQILFWLERTIAHAIKNISKAVRRL